MTIPLLYPNPATGISAPDTATTELAVTANTTLTVVNNGALYTNAGANTAVTITLPAISEGLCYDFLAIAANNLLVKSAEGNNIVAANTVLANTVAFQSANDIIGGHMRLFTNANGTKWYIRKWSSNALTIS